MLYIYILYILYIYIYIYVRAVKGKLYRLKLLGKNCLPPWAGKIPKRAQKKASQYIAFKTIFNVKHR